MTENELKVLIDNATYSYFTIEVGTWLGRSSTVLSKSGRLVCVDKFNGKLDGHKLHKETLSIVKRNLKEFKNIQFLKGDSGKLANNFPNDCADLILIDAGHSYEEAKSDIEKYFEKVKIGGKMLVHDYGTNWTGVNKACDEFKEEKKSICTTRVVPGTTFFEIVKI
jgi:predicted O-methyltransferase YrrM